LAAESAERVLANQLSEDGKHPDFFVEEVEANKSINTK